MIKEIENKVRELVDKNVELDEDIKNIKNEDRLENYGLNSLNLVKLVVAIENEYDIEFDDEGLNFENFQSIQVLIEYILEKINN